jgi:hypothetical protein
LPSPGKYGGILEQTGISVMSAILLIIIPGSLMDGFSQISPEHMVRLFDLVRHICLYLHVVHECCLLPELVKPGLDAFLAWNMTFIDIGVFLTPK